MIPLQVWLCVGALTIRITTCRYHYTLPEKDATLIQWFTNLLTASHLALHIAEITRGWDENSTITMRWKLQSVKWILHEPALFVNRIWIQPHQKYQNISTIIPEVWEEFETFYGKIMWRWGLSVQWWYYRIIWLSVIRMMLPEVDTQKCKIN